MSKENYTSDLSKDYNDEENAEYRILSGDFNQVPDKKERNRRLDLRRILETSILGGLRTYLVTFGIQGVQNILYILLSILRRKKSDSIKEALFSKDTRRLALTSASFTFTWKALSQILPIYTKFKQTTNDFIAGSLAGLSIFLETRENRFDYSQTIIFRALQGLATSLSQDGILNIPFGNVLFFTLSASQYLYTHSLYPEIYPLSEIKLLNTMSGIPSSILETNRQLLSEKSISPGEMVSAIPEGHSTRTNLNFIANLNGLPPVVPCEALHLSYNNCTHSVIGKALYAFKMMLPIYTIVNVGTKLLFGGSKAFQNPTKELKRIMTKTLKSGVFIAAYVGIYQFTLCRIHNLPWYFPKFRAYRPLYFLAAVFTCLSTYWIDTPQRISNLSYYMAPRALYSFYKINHLNGRLPAIPHFESFLFSFSAGIIMSCLKDRPDALDSILSEFLKFVVDRDMQADQLPFFRRP